jgi:hypothetical protein
VSLPALGSAGDERLRAAAPTAVGISNALARDEDDEDDDEEYFDGSRGSVRNAMFPADYFESTPKNISLVASAIGAGGYEGVAIYNDLQRMG